MNLRTYIAMTALALFAASQLPAQTLTSRTSRVNYGYVYGAGGDSNTDSDIVEDYALLPTDTETTGYIGSTSGSLPDGQPYSAGVECGVTHTYTITGALSAFETISASASVEVQSSASGAGLANVWSTNPGNELKFEFNVVTSVHYELNGHFFHPNPGVFHGVLLERFNGSFWNAVFSTFFTPNGPFNQSGILTPGQYRMFSFIGVSAQSNESFSSNYDYVLTIHRAADMNCDGLVNGQDVSAFVTALLDGPAYDAAYPDCRRMNADVNFDNSVTADDITPFSQCVLEGGCQ